MRCFIALEVPDGFRDEVAALARQVKDTVPGRYPSPETYHLTLAFLGEVSEQEARLAMDAIDASCEGVGPIRLHPEGLGKFGRRGDATLWLGLAEDEEMKALASSIREELSVRGVGFDGKAFKPHLTIARRAKLPGDGLAGLPFPHDAEASLVTLFKSTLGSGGATYKALYSRELA